MIVKKETLNTTLSASALVVSIIALLIMVMGALAAVIITAFLGGLLIGVFITHYVRGDQKNVRKSGAPHNGGAGARPRLQQR